MGHEALIHDLIGKLMDNIRQSHSEENVALVAEAVALADKVHKGQVRKSGEPYVIHPLNVALILTEVDIDIESVIAGVLHDVIEDTVLTRDDLKNKFGEEVAVMVDGVTELSKLELEVKRLQQEAKDAERTSRTGRSAAVPDEARRQKTKAKNNNEDEQAENYRKMFLAAAKDARVILIKVADRLHNMRTLQHMPPEKQKAKARETLRIYCPLAHRLGLSTWRRELEDLSFMYSEPQAYLDLADKVKRKQAGRLAYTEKVVVAISENLKEADINAHVHGRAKHLFSIQKKMKKKNVTLDEIYDLFAVRIVTESKADCYMALSVVHEMYPPMNERFKDYIATPKPNGYRSLHTTVMGPEGEPVEIQIRTKEMHKISEYGITTAHFFYKEGGKGKVSNEDRAWLEKILNLNDEISDNAEFMDAVSGDLDVYTGHLTCFTPKGELIRLPYGSTPLDFAYAIHSAVGHNLINVRVNGKIVPINYKLASSDQVEIITSRNSKGPKRDWLNIVKTGQAKNKINQWFNKENKEENIVKGKKLLEKEAQRKGYVLSELQTEAREQNVLKRLNFKDWNGLCAAVGHGGVKESQVINRLQSLYDEEQKKINPPEIIIDNDEKKLIERNRKKKSGISVKGIGDTHVRFSRCCNPIPGDEVVAFTTRGRGVSLHRTDCTNVINLVGLERERLQEAHWDLPEKTADSMVYPAHIRVIGMDRPSLLNDVLRVIAEEKISLQKTLTRTVAPDAIFDLTFPITGVEQLERVQKRILNVPDIHSIERTVK